MVRAGETGGSIVEKQDVAVGQYGRRMMAGERGSTELPVDLGCPSIDRYHGRDVAEAEHDGAVGHFAEPIAEGPRGGVDLYSRDAVSDGIEMLPALPLPQDFSVCRHLHEIVADHLPVVDFGPGTAAADLLDDRIRKRLLADQKDISVPQSDAVVGVIGMTHLPQDPPLPIRFQRGATHVGRPADKARIWDLAVAEERPAVGEIAVEGRGGHIPAMNNIPQHIDEVDGLVGARYWGEQCKPREGAVRIVAAKADTAALYGVRFNPSLCRRARNRLGHRLPNYSEGAPQSPSPSTSAT